MRRQAFIIRVWQDENGRCWGQIVEPLTDKRITFTSQESLFQALKDQMDTPALADQPHERRRPEGHPDNTA